MNLDIQIKIPKWNTKPGIWNDFAEMAVVKFPNCDFEWIPTYKQLVEIYQKIHEAEEMNKRKAKQASQSCQDSERGVDNNTSNEIVHCSTHPSLFNKQRVIE